jgi:hypothetical protein
MRIRGPESPSWPTTSPPFRCVSRVGARIARWCMSVTIASQSCFSGPTKSLDKTITEWGSSTDVDPLGLDLLSVRDTLKLPTLYCPQDLQASSSHDNSPPLAATLGLRPGQAAIGDCIAQSSVLR